MDVKTIRHSMVLPATSHEVYEALIDSAGHTAFTGQPANISREINGESTAYGGSLFFRNLELIPDKKIVQAWQSPANKEWPRDHFSTVTYELHETPKGTQLNFTQEGVPAAQLEHYIEGWTTNYWTRLSGYFNSKRSQEQKRQ